MAGNLHSIGIGSESDGSCSISAWARIKRFVAPREECLSVLCFIQRAVSRVLLNWGWTWIGESGQTVGGIAVGNESLED